MEGNEVPAFSANLSLLFTEVELLGRPSAAKAQGFDAVEIQFPYGEPAPVLRDAMDSAGVRLVLFNVPAGDLMAGGEGLAGVPEKRDDFRRAVDRALGYAEVLQPNCVNVLPGRVRDADQRPAHLAALLDNLHLAAEAFQPLGIKTVFEAINRFDMPEALIDRSEQMLDILAVLRHPNLFMQYDVYHMSRMGDDAAAFITRHGNSIGHIQFADVPGRAQPGTGSLDFDTIFSAIDDSPFSGFVGAEYRPGGMTAASFGWYRKWRRTY